MNDFHAIPLVFVMMVLVTTVVLAFFGGWRAVSVEPQDDETTDLDDIALGAEESQTARAA